MISGSLAHFLTDVNGEMTGAIESKDPQQILGFMKAHKEQIIKDQNYMPLLVCVLKEFQPNLEVNEQTLKLVCESIKYAESTFIGSGINYIAHLHREGGLKQIIENMSIFHDNLNIASLSFLILEAVAHCEVYASLLSETKTLKAIVSTMAAHEVYFAKVRGKGISILLDILKTNKCSTEISDSFGSAGVIDVLSCIILSAALNKKSPSEAIKILSLLNLSNDAFRDYEEQVRNAFYEIFEGIKIFTEQEDREQHQEFMSRETVLHTFTLTTKIVSRSQSIQKYFIEKGYLGISVRILFQFLRDEEVLLCGSKTIMSFNMMEKDTKKAASDSFFGLFFEIFKPAMSPSIHIAYFKILYSTVVDDEDFSTRFIKSGLLKEVIELIENSPKQKEVQEHGLNAVSAAITCTTDSIDDSLEITFDGFYGILERQSQKETIKISLILLVSALNVTPLSNSNVITMMSALGLSAKFYDKGDERLKTRYEDFRRASEDVLEKIDKNCGATFFIESMKMFFSDTGIVRSCLAALANILYLKGKTLSNFNVWGGMKSVLDIMVAYPRDDEIQRLCLKIFVNVLTNGDCLLTLSNANGIELVTKAMSSHITSGKVQQWGSYVLASYAQIPLFKQRLEKEDILFLVHRALKCFPENLDVQSSYCSYLFMVTPSNKALKDFIRKFECQKKVLEIFKEKRTKALHNNGFCGFYNLVINFDIVDIPNEEGLAITSIFEFMKMVAENGDEEERRMRVTRKGVLAISRILKCKPCAQSELDKEPFVRFILDVTARYGDKPEACEAAGEIFSRIDFVQDRDTVDAGILERISSILDEREKHEKQLTRACLILLLKLGALNDLVKSPHMEHAVKTLFNIGRDKKYYDLFQEYCLGIIVLVVTKENIISVATEVLGVVSEGLNPEAKSNLDGRTLLSLERDELLSLGFPEALASKLAIFTRDAIVAIAPKFVPRSVQGKAIRCQPLPPLWREVLIGQGKVYFSTTALEFQREPPGAKAEEIAQYNTFNTKKFLECVGFKAQGFFWKSSIFGVFKKEGIIGKELMNKSYSELVSLKVSEEEAKKLRLVLAPLATKDDLINFDVDDTCIWAEAIGVSPEALRMFRNHNITGTKLNDPDLPKHLDSFFDIKDKDDRDKITESIAPLGGEIIGNSITSLDSLLKSFPSNYIILEESLKKAEFINVKDMLDDAKEKWDTLDAAQKSVLTEEEAAAIFVYTYDFGKDDWERNPFRVVNKTLGERNTHALPRLCGYILHLLSALRKLPKLDNGKVLYRGVKGSVSPSMKKVGSVMSWPAFTSATLNENIVGNFIEGARSPTVFEIRGAFCGYDISPFSASGGEREVLLEPETTFRVAEVKEDDSKFPGATRIVVDVIESPLVIKDMVTKFNREKRKRIPIRGSGVSQWELEDAVQFIKVSALEMIGKLPPYCSFKEAFEKAKFGCAYSELEEELKFATDKRRKPINSERRVRDEEALAIFSYTIEKGGDSRPYRVVNTALAERSTKVLSVYPYIFHLLSALRKLPVYENQGKLYRGIDGELLREETYKVGNTLTWPAFTSTTYEKESAYDFVNKNPRVTKKVVFEITGKVRGYDISDFSMYPSEREVLLEPENKFKITSIKPDPDNSDIEIISVEIIETPPVISEAIDAFMSGRNLLPLNQLKHNDAYYANLVTKKTQWKFSQK